MKISSAEIKEKARQLGTDLVGIASADRFDEAPEGFKPTDLLPGAQSVIVMAKRIPKAVIKSNVVTTYTMLCSDLFKKLDSIAYELACFIEDNGGQSMPVPSDTPYEYWEEENSYGMGDLSNRHAAKAAGLGVLGKNSLLITPEYGNRVQLVSIVTDLAIEADPILEQKLCPDNCKLCVEVCPMGALNGNQKVNQKLCRKNINKKLPRGFEVYNCWECRKICPAGGQ